MRPSAHRNSRRSSCTSASRNRISGKPRTKTEPAFSASNRRWRFPYLQVGLLRRSCWLRDAQSPPRSDRSATAEDLSPAPPLGASPERRFAVHPRLASVLSLRACVSRATPPPGSLPPPQPLSHSSRLASTWPRLIGALKCLVAANGVRKSRCRKNALSWLPDYGMSYECFG
jgi:hypothetical protein